MAALQSVQMTRPEAPTHFMDLLVEFRKRCGYSRNGLAIEVGINPSYLTRIENGDREPPRLHIVDALARTLRLTTYEHNRLRVAGGYAAVPLGLMGEWTHTMQAVADVLTNDRLSTEDLEEFNGVVQSICSMMHR